MSIRKTLNDLAETDNAIFETPNCGSEVRVYDDRSQSVPIKVTIDGEWFDAEDLRKTAKLLKRLADMLEEQGRGG
jgi:hypothetical protein